MGTVTRHKQFLNTKLVAYFLYALIPLALLHYFLFPLATSEPPPPQPDEIISSSLPPSHAGGAGGGGEAGGEAGGGGGGGGGGGRAIERENGEKRGLRCDYSDGRWVFDPRGPLYNGTSCATIKDGQNCMGHGRPDTGYLYWRWQPDRCELPPFEPSAFLRLIRNRHVAFVGDSMARNQAESLLCLLATSESPDLVYRDGADNKFRRWIFPAHNATVSVFWSPFLVRAIEKDEAVGVRHNRVFLDAFDERWTSDLDRTDVVVVSFGHWFLIPGIYHERGEIAGCHYCPELNHTDTGFFDVFRKAIRNTLAEVRRILDSSAPRGSRRRLVAATTFSPAHFEGEWDKAGACPKKDPYREGEKVMQYMDEEMRRIVVEEVAAAAAAAAEGDGGSGVRFEALDVTKLAMMRPDGHPGPYMYANPFAGRGGGGGGGGDGEGAEMRVQNDCVHWCLPGPVDTFNEILLQVMRGR